MSAHNKINFEHHDSPFILHHAETARCAIDENGMIVYANDAFYELGELNENAPYSASDVFSFADDTLQNARDFSALPAGEHTVHIKGNPIVTEFHFDRLTTADGRDYLIASAADSIEEETDQDTLDELMARIQHSTARIEHTHDEPAAPESSHDDWEAFIGMTNDIMMILDDQGDIASANDTFTQKLGYTSECYVSFLDLFADEDKHGVRSSLQSLIHEDLSSEREIIDFTSRAYTKDGKALWIEWRQKYDNGKIYVTGHDITSIKEKENHLRRRRDQLTEAEAIARMGHWRWLIGADDVSCSAEIHRIFGVNEDSFSPTISAMMKYVHKRDLGRVMQVFQRAMIEEKSYDMEFQITRPDGETRFIMCEGRCEKNEDGEVIALFGIMQDMTERMLYEQELRRARDASEQAYAAKSRFLANMSHELRTPLNAIIGFSEMIEGELLGPIFNEKYLEYSTSIKESGQHLLDLISDILDMSKIEAGKHSLDLEDIRVCDVIRRAVQMVQGRAQDKHIELSTPDEATTDIMITADRRAITQVMLNLLSNAVKFTTAHGKIDVTCTQNESGIELRVKDTGIGIPPNKLAAVIRPFEQASNEYTRDHEGTGLGLAISKELIDLHHGEMVIESTVDIGTTVTVRLPYNAK